MSHRHRGPVQILFDGGPLDGKVGLFLLSMVDFILVSELSIDQTKIIHHMYKLGSSMPGIAEYKHSGIEEVEL